MCTDDIDQTAPSNEKAGLSRRGLLGAAAVTALAATAGGILSSRDSASATAPTGSSPSPAKGLSVTLLGTAGGPPPQQYRSGISSALVVDGKTYVIDCGRGAVSQFMKAGLSMPSLTAIFLTHLHSDHTVDYFSFPVLAGGVTGPQGFQTPIGVWGPGPSGLPSVLTDGPAATPGTVAMTALANESFAASTTFFVAEHLFVIPATMLEVHDVLPPASSGASPTNPAPSIAPFDVMEDDRVKVTATLVPHGAVWPALAYRFDTDYGSVVFSGDTALTPNIPRLAQGADLLVHEAADFAALPKLGYPDAVVEHIKLVHTDVTQLGAVAKQSNVRKLVATHLSPVAPTVVSDQAWRQLLLSGGANAGYRGEIVLGMDLMRIPVTGRRR